MFINSEEEAMIGQVFESFLREYHHHDILQLIADADQETHHPVIVNAVMLFESSMEVGAYFNAFPSDVLDIFDKVLQRTALDISQNASPIHYKGQRTKGQQMRCTLHARITGLPICPELIRETIPRCSDIGHFLCFTGTIIRTSVAKVLEYERDYMCDKCRHVFSMQVAFDQFNAFVPPVTCPNPVACNSYKFSCLSRRSEPAARRDYQEIKIQEQAHRLSVGSIPRSMVAVLEDDLVDSCKSGDDVTVYGVMCQRWKPLYEGTVSDVEMVLKANNIEIHNQPTPSTLLNKDVQQVFADFWDNNKHNPIAGMNQILLSLCPQICGMYVIKLAMAMVLAGGVQRIDSSGTKIRGECHMLLVGDPGTGKSQFLKYAAKILPHSVLTAGIGATSAGLTVAAVKDGGEWHLEAGALVLADGGLCCIDEFNSIKEHDRVCIHEAMEQQSISVAKAGIVCKLSTSCTILAATNPKGQYNPNEPLSVNVALASPLLSRFDLILVLLDTRNAERDHIISSFILEGRGLAAKSSSLWSMDRLQAYFCIIKHLQPQLSDEANSILTCYYQLQRKRDGCSAARVTIRMLESLSRLAEAHAKLMYRETVTIEDAVMAVCVMECSMQGGTLLGNVNALLTSFPEDPVQQYEAHCQIVLGGLNLPLLLQKEMGRLARLKINSSVGSQSNSKTAQYQLDPRDANTQHKTPGHGVTAVSWGDATEESGLDWFHSITLSGSQDDLSPPSMTSTQEILRKNPNSVGAKTSTAFKQPNGHTEEHFQKHTDSRLSQARTSTAEEENSTNEKNECIKEQSSICQEVHQLEKLKDDQHSKSSGCVFQRVSKNLRDRRLRELESHDLQCNKGEGRGHEDSFSSGETLPSINLRHNSASCGKPKTLESEGDGRCRRKKAHSVSEGADWGSLDGACSTSVELDRNVLSSGKEKSDQDKSVSRVKKINDSENHQQRTRDNYRDEQTEDDFTGDTHLNATTHINDSSLRNPGHTKPTIASSTLEKLLRFSYTPTTKPKTTAQLEIKPPTEVENVTFKRKHGTESLTGTNCKAQQTKPATAVKRAMSEDFESLSTVSLQKRRCFEMGNPPNIFHDSKGLFSTVSLFDSGELSNDVLDADWDQEL